MVDPRWRLAILSVVTSEREEHLMTYVMPAIADTVDLEGALTDLAFSIRCTQCDVDAEG